MQFVPECTCSSNRNGHAVRPEYALLLKLNESESKNLFELIHKRRKKSSTIFCSQFREEGWYERLGGDDNPLADAIMDRIVYDAYKINIESIDPSKDVSMREVYGLDPANAQ